MKFKGYKRADGRIGVRNYLAVIPSVFCANHVARKIAENVKDAVCLTHQVGCSQVGEDLEQTARTLVNIATHPNIGGVLIVGLGCERFSAQEFYEKVKETKRPVQKVLIQDEGDSLNAISKGTTLLLDLYNQIINSEKEEFDIAELIVGIECGGSDAFSGIAANPSVGAFSDKLISQGGTVIFSEVTELLGAENILKKRCFNEEVEKLLLETIKKTETSLKKATADLSYQNRTDLISKGNYDGGISTVAEKALGNIEKAGKSPINGVLKFAEKVNKKGLFLMDTPGHDAESTTGLVAGGAQIVLFTTGRGTPTGFPVVPVVKITGNSDTYNRMRSNIDINTGEVIEGKRTIIEMGEEIFNFVLKTASGEQTKAEIFGNDELFSVARVLYS